MKRVKFLWIFVLGLFLCGLVSADGLSIVGDDTFTINKIYDEPAYIELTIRNNESFDFTDVGMDNSYITMDIISTLHSGENRTVNATIVMNDDIPPMDIKIFGYFYAPDTGLSNITHEINLLYSDRPPNCNLEIMQGDNVIWHNLDINEFYYIDLFYGNSDTNIFIPRIYPESSSVLKSFDLVEMIYYNIVFKDRTYSAYYCNLEIKNTSGYVSLKQYDTKINIKVNVEYPPTELKIHILNDSYSMEFHETRRDFFVVTNTGYEIAKNIHLSAEWFTFDDNNFTLVVGEPRTIWYNITPTIYESNETNKIYLKNLTITGNFPNINKEFSIFIKYAEIVNDTGQNVTTFKDWLCENYPEFCEPQIIYKYIDPGEAEFNVTYTENQVKRLYDLFFDFMDEQAIKNKQSVEYQDMMDLKLGNIENSTSGTNVDITNINDRISDTNDVWKFAAWIFGMIVTGLLLTFLALKYQDKFRRNAWNRYG